MGVMTSNFDECNLSAHCSCPSSLVCHRTLPSVKSNVFASQMIVFKGIIVNKNGGRSKQTPWLHQKYRKVVDSSMLVGQEAKSLINF